MGHIHSENMELYARDAAIYERPWELWMVNFPWAVFPESLMWHPLGNNHPLWDKDANYCRRNNDKEDKA